MKRTNYIKAIADGVLQGFCGTKVLLGIAFSQFATETPIETHLIIACLIPLITAIVYFLLIHKEQSNKNLLKLSATSFLCFVISFPILFALPFTVFPQREIGDAEGIGLMLIVSFFILSAVVLRLGTFVGVLVRNKKNT